MKCLINAINLKAAGGLTVALNFLQCLRDVAEFHNHVFHVLAPAGAGYEMMADKHISIEIVPARVSSPLHRLYMDYLWLNNRINEIKPDVVFTMGNIAVPTGFPQAVLFMFPYATYPEETHVWKLLGWSRQLDYRIRNRIFANRLKYAQVVFPQTTTSQGRLITYYGNRINEMEVVPAAYTKPSGVDAFVPSFKKQSGCKYLLSLTHYYPHKNLEILIPLARILRERQSSIRVITTVESNQGRGASLFIDRVRRENLEEWVINIGRVPLSSVPALYGEVDGLLLPTLLESFSSTYPDSMYFRKPVFTSDRDFARDVCGDAAFYFNPLNAEEIFNVLDSAFADSALISKKIQMGFERVNAMPDWLDITRAYMEKLKDIASNQKSKTKIL